MKAAVDLLNKHGGVAGHHIVLTVKTDQEKATNAVSDLQSALSGGNTPNLVWPGSSSTTGEALAPTLTRDKILANGVVSAPSVVTPRVNPYLFNVTGSLKTQGQDLAKYFKSKGDTRVGLLYENFIIGQEEEGAEAAALKAAGITVSAVNYPPTALNVTPQMESLKSDNVQAVLLDGLGQPDGLALAARATMAWSAPVVGDALDGGTFDPKGVSATQLKGVEWLVQNVEVYKAHESPAFTTFYKAVKKVGPIDVPLFEYAAGWDVVMQADDAAKQAHSIAATKMAAALNHLKKLKQPNYVLAPYESYSATTHALTVPLSVVPMAVPTGGMYNVPVHAKLP
jgi:branched-chain amino acid transport system substrate-binding protein